MLYLYLCVQVIRSREMEKAELELFPRHLLFLRQQPPARTPQSNGWMNMGKAEHIRVPGLYPALKDIMQSASLSFFLCRLL